MASRWQVSSRDTRAEAGRIPARIWAGLVLTGLIGVQGIRRRGAVLRGSDGGLVWLPD